MTAWMLTGHRRYPNGLWVASQLERVLGRLRAEERCLTGVSGLALGADTVWADLILENGLDLVSCVPHAQQGNRWPEEHKRTRERLILASSAVHAEIGSPSEQADLGEHWEFHRVEDYDPANSRWLFARNARMVGLTQGAVAVWSGSPRSGTGSCVNVIKRAEMPLILIDPERKTVTRKGYSRSE
jgi:hypothetical protein